MFHIKHRPAGCGSNTAPFSSFSSLPRLLMFFCQVGVLLTEPILGSHRYNVYRRQNLQQETASHSSFLLCSIFLHYVSPHGSHRKSWTEAEKEGMWWTILFTIFRSGVTASRASNFNNHVGCLSLPSSRRSVPVATMCCRIDCISSRRSRSSLSW